MAQDLPARLPAAPSQLPLRTLAIGLGPPAGFAAGLGLALFPLLGALILGVLGAAAVSRATRLALMVASVLLVVLIGLALSPLWALLALVPASVLVSVLGPRLALAVAAAAAVGLAVAILPLAGVLVFAAIAATAASRTVRLGLLLSTSLAPVALGLVVRPVWTLFVLALALGSVSVLGLRLTLAVVAAAGAGFTVAIFPLAGVLVFAAIAATAASRGVRVGLLLATSLAPIALGLVVRPVWALVVLALLLVPVSVLGPRLALAVAVGATAGSAIGISPLGGLLVLSLAAAAATSPQGRRGLAAAGALAISMLGLAAWPLWTLFVLALVALLVCAWSYARGKRRDRDDFKLSRAFVGGARRIAWPAGAGAGLLMSTIALLAAPLQGVVTILVGCLIILLATQTVAFSVRTAAALAVAVLCVAVIPLALGIWPVFTLACAAVLSIILVAAKAPSVAFVLSVLSFGVEGSLKLLLGETGAPFPGSTDAAGAALLDLGFAAGVIGLLRVDRGSALRTVRDGLDRPAKVACLFLVAWLVLSVLQIPQSGSLNAGIAGFRLTQAYAAGALAGVILLARRHEFDRAFRVFLIGLVVILGYAALRAAIGPSEIERAFALTKPATASVGLTLRTIGSFSGAVGLASFAVPAGVFCFATAVLRPRFRRLALLAFAFSLAGLAGTQVRAGVPAIAVGVLVVIVVAWRSDLLTRRGRIVLASLTVATFVLGGAATAAVSTTSEKARVRARAFVDPLHDRSMRIRFSTWSHSLAVVKTHPLGTGLGTVGRASALSGQPATTTDNTYIKVFREQGVIPGALFLGGLLTFLVWSLARLRRVSPERQAVGIPSLAGLTAFLVLALAGEYIEQPGKVLAWMFLGMGMWCAWARASTDASADV